MALERVPRQAQKLYVAISVRTTGSGTDEKTVPHIFESITAPGVRTAIAVESAPDTGSTFTIYLSRVT